MSLAIDIRGLQAIVGGDLVPYQEIVRDEKTVNSRARWPLLAQTGEQIGAQVAELAVASVVAADKSLRRRARPWGSADVVSPQVAVANVICPLTPAVPVTGKSGSSVKREMPPEPLLPVAGSLLAQALRMPAAAVPPAPQVLPVQQVIPVQQLQPVQSDALTDIFKRLESA